MKFELVEPGEEQAMLPETEQEHTAEEPEAVQAQEAHPGIHPRLTRASASMRTRVRADLATLQTSLNRLGQSIAAAHRTEPRPTAQAAPPRNFRAGAFTGRHD
ncbi:hypothetical protein AB0I72_09625 [Nocardiopsis sp. NPDC049922]|uniref:hypothetical protein n=1 Tax=Nocardiopsis sp. NPDC049922 TaxID=3155157 RepID=UPI0033C67BA4